MKHRATLLAVLVSGLYLGCQSAAVKVGNGEPSVEISNEELSAKVSNEEPCPVVIELPAREFRFLYDLQAKARLQPSTLAAVEIFTLELLRIRPPEHPESLPFSAASVPVPVPRGFPFYSRLGETLNSLPLHTDWIDKQGEEYMSPGWYQIHMIYALPRFSKAGACELKSPPFYISKATPFRPEM
jgi:hypothetical protein